MPADEHSNVESNGSSPPPPTAVAERKVPVGSSGPGFRHAAKTSLAVFQNHLMWSSPNPNGPPVCDARGIISRACYEDWLSSRGSHPPGEPEKTFQRIITAHLTGSDGRRPFSKVEEAAILQVLREKRVWPAFEHTNLSIGTKGFRSHGWNEKREAEASEAAGSLDFGEANSAHKRSRLAKTDFSAALVSAASTMQQQQQQQTAMDAAAAGTPFPWFSPAGNLFLPPWISVQRPPVVYTPGSSSPVNATASNATAAVAAAAASTPSTNAPAPTTTTTTTTIGAPATTTTTTTTTAGSIFAPDSAAFTKTPLISFTSVAPSLLPSPSHRTVAIDVSDAGLIVHAVLPALLRLCFPHELPTAPTMQSALMSLASFEARHPGMSAVAVNLAAGSIDDLLIAQNAASVMHIGIVSRLMNGSYRHLIPHTHATALAKQVVLTASSDSLESTLEACALRLMEGEALVNLVMAVDGAVVVIGARL